MKQKLLFQDNSGDRKYFTIIPNYILNHSTLYDREVYIQMKRIAGEDGTCWTSRATLSKKCGISVRKLDSCIKYLIEHKWISLIGTRQVKTPGGYQEVNEYSISDLWKMNIEFYESQGGAHNATPLTKGGAQESQRVCTNEAKGSAPGAHKEEPLYKEEPIKEDIYTFEKFWSIYPKKVGKGNTEKLWKNLPLEVRELILDDIPRRKFDDKWVNGFIKDPERYIKYKQWEDEIISKQKTNGTYKPDNIVQAREGKYASLS